MITGLPWLCGECPEREATTGRVLGDHVGLEEQGEGPLR